MDTNSYASIGMVFYLFALFCVYWAQTSGRNPWLWFFMGWLFAPVTGVALLYKNAQDKKAKEEN